MLEKIPYTKPSITELELSFVSDAAAHGWGPKCYEYIERFEREFADHLGVKHAIATSSCTGAITLAVASLGLGPGDEVILADTNWIASVAPFVHAGVKPVFIDIDPYSWCIDPSKVQSAITSRTKAIMAVHLYGNLADLDRLKALAKVNGIWLIEDAAEALGSTFRGNNAGAIGDVGVFSFHGTKTLTTGEGGMLVTNNDEIYSSAMTLSNHGRARGQLADFRPVEVGYKFKMSNIQAALGCAQLTRIRELVLRKQEVLNFYTQFFKQFPNVQMNPVQNHAISGAWMPTLVLDSKDQSLLPLIKETLLKNGIDARPFFPPLSSLPMFELGSANPNAYSLHERALNLPSFHDITESQQLRVCEAISGRLTSR